MSTVRQIAAALALALAAAGCTTVRESADFTGVKVDAGLEPATLLEVENTGWFLLNYIPLGSGEPNEPNCVSFRPFANTVTLQSNIRVLEREMERRGVSRFVNLTSRWTDEKVFVILLARRAYHTSAVLVKEKQ